MTKAIAIDGPGGAGKSTIAKLVAKKLGYVYVDTGAMYRAMGIFFTRRNIASDDPAAIEAACPDADITIAYEDGLQQVYLNGENVTGEIRTEAAGSNASAFSVHAPVRAKLVELQQKLAKKENVVMDGRDIGTVVLPDADLKVFLTASVETRAMRRFKEMQAKGKDDTLEAIMEDLRIRDERDMTRENSPLRQADDAVLVDSSDMTIDQVSDHIIGLLNQ